MTERKSILVMTSNPWDTDPLHLEEEVREIQQVLRLAGWGKTPIQFIPATRIRYIREAMLDFEPQIVHFSGHADGSDGLVFQDNNGDAQLVSIGTLTNLFKLFAQTTPLECVVLNACYTEPQAQAMAKYIDYVIGTNDDIGDLAAIEFSHGFYAALGAGYPIEFAYELGCISIEMEGFPEGSVPVLFQKGQRVAYQPDLQTDPEEDDDVNLKIEEEQLSVTDSIENNELAQLILKFLRLFDLWFFNATRIKKWGSQQHGFAYFSEYTIKEIKLCLQMLFRVGKLRTKKGKKGTTLYAIK